MKNHCPVCDAKHSVELVRTYEIRSEFVLQKLRFKGYKLIECDEVSRLPVSEREYQCYQCGAGFSEESFIKTHERKAKKNAKKAISRASKR